MTKLYLLKFKKVPPTSITEVLLELFSSISGGYVYGKATYSDPECTNTQCVTGKRRSFDDAYYLVNTYFPDTSPADIMHEILTLEIPQFKGAAHNVFLGTCGTMNRIRIDIIQSHARQNSPLTMPQNDSIYSWKELLAMLNITTIEEFHQYRPEQLASKRRLEALILQEQE